ncbi:hypothetical protein ACWYXN_25090 [Janthinobacterium aestuarii]
MSYETECPRCKTLLVVTERSMGVPGGQEKEQGYCPLCREEVAEFMTDGFIVVKLAESQHQLLQTIFNASRLGIPLPPHVVASAANFIASGIVTIADDGKLNIPINVQHALVSHHQPLKKY